MYHLIQVDANTWAFEDVMPDGDTVRFFLLDGHEKALVIDSGYLPIDVHALAHEVLRENGRELDGFNRLKPILLANTHGDFDHTEGNASFPSFYMTQTDYDLCKIGEKCPDSVLIPAEEGLQIDLGGRVLQYFMAPGHTYGNAVLLDLTNRTLYPGDMIQTGNMFMFGPHRCPEQMAESLKKLCGMKSLYDQIYACHGKIVLDADAADELLAAWNMAVQKQVPPVRKEIFGTMIDMYCCGICNFYCNQDEAE